MCHDQDRVSVNYIICNHRKLEDLYVTVLDSPDVDDDLFEAFSIFSVKLLPMHQLVHLLSFGPIIVFSLLFILLVRIKSLLLSAYLTM